MNKILLIFNLFEFQLLTIMIGTNDFCSDICHQNGGPLWMNEEIEKNIIKTLRIIRDHIPRYGL